MELERKIDLSMVYFIKDLFYENPEINVVDGFPEQLLALPLVSVEMSMIRPIPGELGNHRGVGHYAFFVDVFAKNKAQRDELGVKILHALEDSVPVYNYDEGFPPSVTPSQISCLVPNSLQMDVIQVMPELVDTLYYRVSIKYEAYYNQL